MRRGRGFQAGAGPAGAAGLARREAAARLGIVPEDGGHRDRRRRGAAYRRKPHHRQTRPRRVCARSAIRGCARCSRLPDFAAGTAPSAAPGGVSGRAAHQRRRPHGYRASGGRAVPDRRHGRARELGARNSTSRIPSASRWKPESAMPARPCPRTNPQPRWCTTATAGIAACSASWPAGWWSASTARCSCSAVIEDGAGARLRPQHPGVPPAGRAGIDARPVRPLRRAPHGRGGDARSGACGGVPRAACTIRAAERLKPEDFAPRLEIDGVVELPEVDETAAEEVFGLAPFGCGNPQPVFAALDVEVAGPPAMFAEKGTCVSCSGRTAAR